MAKVHAKEISLIDALSKLAGVPELASNPIVSWLQENAQRALRNSHAAPFDSTNIHFSFFGRGTRRKVNVLVTTTAAAPRSVEVSVPKEVAQLLERDGVKGWEQNTTTAKTRTAVYRLKYSY